MNLIKNTKSNSVYIVTITLSIICLHTQDFLPRACLSPLVYKHYWEVLEINLNGQRDYGQNLYAKSDGPILTNPDWVPPVNRSKYPGYQILEDAKGTSESWKYSTNRPGGKIKGGGTVKYRDYRSVTRQTRPESGGGAGKPGK